MKFEFQLNRYPARLAWINRPQIIDRISHGIDGEETTVLGAEKFGQWKLSVRRQMMPSGMWEWIIELVALQASDAIAPAVRMKVDGWTREGFLVMPAAVYNGNRFESVRAPYPPMPPQGWGKRGLLISDIPRLDTTLPQSSIELLGGDLSAPCIGYFIPQERRGFWLTAPVQTELGTTGFAFHERLDSDDTHVTLSFPGVRKHVFQFCSTLSQSNDRPPMIQAGSRFELRFSLDSFPCDSRQALFNRFPIARAVYASDPQLPRAAVPMSVAFKILETKFNQDSWFNEAEGLGHYGPGTYADNPYDNWQPGWVGGGISSLGLLEIGSPQTRFRAIQTLEFAFGAGLAPTGLPYAIFDGKNFYGDVFDQCEAPWLLIRKAGDLLLFAVRHVQLLRRRGQAVPAIVEAGIKRLADALVEIWDRYGEFGQFVDYNTLEMRVSGSTSGAIIPAALAEAAAAFDLPEARRVAFASGEFYWNRDGVSCIQSGAAGEIMQAPDSEAAVALLESMVTLFEHAHDEGRIRLQRATDLAYQCLTWQCSYNFKFPPDTLFGQLGILTNGAWHASVQNIGPCPAMCTHSGAMLLRLFRYSGDELFLKALQDGIRSITQYLCREDYPIAGLKPGWISERIATSDVLNKIGTIHTGSCWPESSLLLAAAELPGIFARSDLQKAWSLDAIDAEWIGHDSGGVLLSNKTAFPAVVTIAIEHGPAKAGARLKHKVVDVAAGGTIIVSATE